MRIMKTVKQSEVLKMPHPLRRKITPEVQAVLDTATNGKAVILAIDPSELNLWRTALRREASRVGMTLNMRKQPKGCYAAWIDPPEV